MSRSFVHRLRVEKKGFRRRRRRRRRRRFFFFFFFLSYFVCSKRRRRHRSIDQSVLLRMHAGPFAEVQVVENGHVPQVQGQRVVVLVLVRIDIIIFLFFWNTPPNAIFFSVDSKCPPPPPRSMFVFFFFSLRASASRSVESLERHERHSASTAKAESMTTTTMIFDASWIWCVLRFA